MNNGALRQAIVAEAMSWIGTPYHPAARVKGPRGGVDCAMLLAEVYARVGAVAPLQVEHYPPDWHLNRDDERLMAVVLAHARETEGEPSPGDALLFRVGRAFAHAAICIGWPRVVHADRGAGAVVLGDVLADPFAYLKNGARRPMRVFRVAP